MEILNVWGYASSYLSAFAALGIAWYLLDRQWGVHLYRWVYDLFHKESMPRDVMLGFMYNQPTNRKVTVAFVISTIQSLYMISHGQVNFMVEIIMWLLEVPAMLVGFALGSWVHRFLVKRSEIFDRLDDFGEKVKTTDTVHLRKKMDGGAKTIGDRLRNLPGIIVGKVWDIVYPLPATKDVETKVETPPTADVIPEKVSGGREALDRYTRRS